MLGFAASFGSELDGLEFWPVGDYGGCGFSDLPDMCRYEVYPEEDATQTPGLANVKRMSKKGWEEIPTRFLVIVYRPHSALYDEKRMDINPLKNTPAFMGPWSCGF